MRVDLLERATQEAARDRDTESKRVIQEAQEQLRLRAMEMQQQMGQMESSMLDHLQEQLAQRGAAMQQQVRQMEGSMLDLLQEQLSQREAEMQTQVRQVEDSVRDLLEEHQALFSDLSSSFDDKIHELRSELDLRDTLLRCAEELSFIGNVIGKTEARLDKLETYVGFPLSKCVLNDADFAAGEGGARRLKSDRSDCSEATQLSTVTMPPMSSPKGTGEERRVRFSGSELYSPDRPGPGRFPGMVNSGLR